MARGLPNKASAFFGIDPPVQAKPKKKLPAKLDLTNLIPASWSSRHDVPEYGAQAKTFPDLDAIRWSSNVTLPTAYTSRPLSLSHPPDGRAKSISSVKKGFFRRKKAAASAVSSLPPDSSLHTHQQAAKINVSLQHLYDHYEQRTMLKIHDAEPYEDELAHAGEAEHREIVPISLDHPSYATPPPSASDIGFRLIPANFPDEDDVMPLSSHHGPPPADDAFSVSSRHTGTSRRTERSLLDLRLNSVLSLSSDSEDDAPGSTHIYPTPTADRAREHDRSSGQSTLAVRPSTAQSQSLSINSSRDTRRKPSSVKNCANALYPIPPSNSNAGSSKLKSKPKATITPTPTDLVNTFQSTLYPSSLSPPPSGPVHDPPIPPGKLHTNTIQPTPPISPLDTEFCDSHPSPPIESTLAQAKSTTGRRPRSLVVDGRGNISSCSLIDGHGRARYSIESKPLSPDLSSPGDRMIAVTRQEELLLSALRASRARIDKLDPVRAEKVVRRAASERRSRQKKRERDRDRLAPEPKHSPHYSHSTASTNALSGWASPCTTSQHADSAAFERLYTRQGSKDSASRRSSHDSGRHKTGSSHSTPSRSASRWHSCRDMIGISRQLKVSSDGEDGDVAKFSLDSDDMDFATSTSGLEIRSDFSSGGTLALAPLAMSGSSSPSPRTRTGPTSPNHRGGNASRRLPTLEEERSATDLAQVNHHHEPATAPIAPLRLGSGLSPIPNVSGRPDRKNSSRTSERRKSTKSKTHTYFSRTLGLSLDISPPSLAVPANDLVIPEGPRTPGSRGPSHDCSASKLNMGAAAASSSIVDSATHQRRSSLNQVRLSAVGLNCDFRHAWDGEG